MTGLPITLPGGPRLLRLGLSVVACTLVAILVAGAAPKSPQAAKKSDEVKETALPPKKSAQKPKEAGKAPALAPADAQLKKFREMVEKHRFLVSRIGQTHEEKTRLESRLDRAKKAPAGRQVIDRFLSEREIDNLLAQLHLTTDELVRLRKEKDDHVESLRLQAAEFKKAFEKRTQGLERSLERKNLHRDVAGRLRVEVGEVTQYLAILSELAGSAREAEAALGRGPEPARPVSADMRRIGVSTMIRRLERQQESLLRIWQKNEASLRQLRVMAPEAEGASSEDEPGRQDASPPGVASRTGRAVPAFPAIPAPLLRPRSLDGTSPQQSPAARRP
jgi:hypothetical protein